MLSFRVSTALMTVMRAWSPSTRSELKSKEIKMNSQPDWVFVAITKRSSENPNRDTLNLFKRKDKKLNFNCLLLVSAL